MLPSYYHCCCHVALFSFILRKRRANQETGKKTKGKKKASSKSDNSFFNSIKKLGQNKKKDKDGNIRYVFETQTTGENTCKSPRGMFPTFEIANDLKVVIDAITEYEN